MSNLEQSWNKILTTTDTLEESAAQQDWESVASLAANRHQLITEHFKQHPVGPNTAEFYQACLGHFLQKEASLRQLATDARAASMRANVKINNNIKAMAAYQQA